MKNNIEIKISAKLNNVAVVRLAISSFISNLNITVDEIVDVKTAVSEAVTNAIEHGYLEDGESNEIVVKASIDDEEEIIKISVIDYGIGIEDVDLAMTPEYTTKSEEEHAGMGFTIMETFMDEVIVDSKVNKGTSINMTKKVKRRSS